MDEAALHFALVVVGGIVAQWVAWRAQLPSILVLLLTGFLIGNWVDPDRLFGELLMPFVSLSVAVILFEGGLELRIRELRQVGHAIFRLITLGIVVTWFLAAVSAHYLLSMNWNTSVLVGAILVVTGPTVVGPLLRQIQPSGQAGPTLKWEAILNDAIGAVLAVLVFEAILAGPFGNAPVSIVIGVVRTLLTGTLIGIAAGFVLVFLIRRYIIPEPLHAAATVAAVIATFTLSNSLQQESGLLTVTVMGIVIANQRFVNVRHLVEFKENLRVLLLAVLFVLLAARIEPRQLTQLGWSAAAFVLFLIFVARPLTVFLCTLRTPLKRSDRIFMSFMAPRGIVAAAVASVFALRMNQEGLAQADLITPTVFIVITVTVAFYGLSARPLARRLGLSKAVRQGVVFIGASILPRQIAAALKKEGIPTLLIDINRRHVRDSKLAGLDARQGDALSENLLNELDLRDMGKLLALTANDQVNSLASLHFAQLFGREEVYQIAPDVPEAAADDSIGLPRHLRGRTFASPKCTQTMLSSRLIRGGNVKTTKLTREFDYAAYQKQYGEHAIPLFVITEDGRLRVRAEGIPFAPQPGSRLISVVDAESTQEQRDKSSAAQKRVAKS